MGTVAKAAARGKREAFASGRAHACPLPALLAYVGYPSTGCIDAVIDATALVAEMVADLEALTEPVCAGPCSGWDFVLNGIAYDADNDDLYLTGKNWPAIFVYRDPFG